MIYYFLPDPGRFGGVKVACQFIEQLNGLGLEATAVLPGGVAPQWFTSSVPVISEESALTSIKAGDWAMITWPPDFERLKPLPAKLACHCQGTDELMYPIFADASVPILSCWAQAAEFVKEHFNRTTIHVGLSIPDPFFFDATVKLDNRVAYMPRRGYPIVRDCMRRCSGVDFCPIDGMDEHEVSKTLKQSGIFLATAVGEQFGLPALEAMAAGCLVLTVPVIGGLEYLHHEENCLIVKPGEMATVLQDICRPDNQAKRQTLRSQAIATAVSYRAAAQRKLLKGQVAPVLRELFS